MTRKYILTTLLLLCSWPLFAQIGELRHNWSIGANGGLNLNRISLNPRLQQKFLLAPTFGVTGRYISEKYFAMICGVQVEVNFTQRGWQEDPEDRSYTYSRTLNYLEVPFLAHLAFGREKGVRFFVNLGPQIAYLLGDKENIGFTQTPMHNASAMYGKPIDNKFDYGIAGGGGLELRTKKTGNFLVEGRYYYGLADFFDSAIKDEFGRAANMVISVRLTYLFDLTK